MNILIRCFCWDPFPYGASNLYSWPRTHMLRCVMTEEPCPTRRGNGGNHFLSCLHQLEWARVARTGRHLVSDEGKKKKFIGSVFDSRWFSITWWRRSNVGQLFVAQVLMWDVEGKVVGGSIKPVIALGERRERRQKGEKMRGKHN